jgi:poly-gamma-glutamate synthesis protein (capsule biosynthesis protein)
VPQRSGDPRGGHPGRAWLRHAGEAGEQADPPIRRPGLRPGDALGELQAVAPAARIVNLEVSITRSAEYWPGKGINYRMHPANVACLTAARIDVCALANNHVLDYGHAGLEETLATLAGAGVQTAGAGASLAAAQRPAIAGPPGGSSSSPPAPRRAASRRRGRRPRSGPAWTC